MAANTRSSRGGWIIFNGARAYTRDGGWSFDVEEARVFSMSSLAEQKREALGGLLSMTIEDASVVLADPDDEPGDPAFVADTGCFDAHEAP